LNNQNIVKEKIFNTLIAESKALEILANSIDEAAILCVETIFNSTGRLVVTGIGKSAIVAQKIVATLNSTGTNAIFMHAADAIHGDLGMIKQEDLVLCISKSGNTPEIKVLIPMIRNFGNKIIGMVSHKESYLYQQADIALWLPMDREADPNNLAPTTSTTLQMAMGDAIAVALLSLRGFSVDEFARFHPGGSLGKQIYLKVDELYIQNEKPKVYLQDSLKNVIIEISSKRLGFTAVVDDNENIRGAITDGDLRRMLERTSDLQGLTAIQLMNNQPKTIAADALAVDALAMMRKYSISQLIVKEGFRYLGVIHIHDLIREGII